VDSPDWLGPVLERNLGRVTAPDELWDRVMKSRVSQAGRIGLRLVWALAASLAVAAGLWGFHSTNGPVPDEAVAIAALSHAGDQLEVRSEKLSEIGAWVKNRTGLDIAFRGEASRMIRVSGACTIKGDAHAVRIAYRAGNHDAALVVSRSSGAINERGHRFLKTAPSAGVAVTSWIMRGETYTMADANPVEAMAACQLCHTDAEHRAIRN
jgi:hypothetical protein